MSVNTIWELIDKNAKLDRNQLYENALKEIEAWYKAGFEAGDSFFDAPENKTLSSMVWEFFQSGTIDQGNEVFKDLPSLASLVVIKFREKAEEITTDLDTLEDYTASFHGAVVEIESWSKIEDEIKARLDFLAEKIDVERKTK